MSRRSKPIHDRPVLNVESQPDDSAEQGQRLQKVLAASGLGSRRQCEDLILTGRVEVDGQIVLELGTRVVAGRQKIRVDGVPLKKPRTVYYLLNKPIGVVTTNRDPSGRERVIDLVPRDHEHIFPVGRLDKSSEGLIIVTNDGELANLLTHPRYGVEKTYQVLVAGMVTPDEMERLKKGVFLAEGFARVVRLTVRSQTKRGTLMEIILDEGRNREIRRLLARVGHKVLKLKRIAIGDVKLADMAPGEYRNMRTDEIRSLRAAAQAVRRKRRGTRHAPATTAQVATSKAAGEAPQPTVSDIDDRFRISPKIRQPRRRVILGETSTEGQAAKPGGRPARPNKHQQRRKLTGKKPAGETPRFRTAQPTGAAPRQRKAKPIHGRGRRR